MLLEGRGGGQRAVGELAENGAVEGADFGGGGGRHFSTRVEGGR